MPPIWAPERPFEELAGEEVAVTPLIDVSGAVDDVVEVKVGVTEFTSAGDGTKRLRVKS